MSCGTLCSPRHPFAHAQGGEGGPGRHILMVMSARTNATIPLRLSPCCISVAGNQGEGAGPMTSKERRDQGLCVDCGAPAVRSIESRPVCRRKSRETGLPLARVSHRARCAGCDAVHRQKSMAGKAARQAIRDGSRASMVRTRALRSASGVCGQCGRHPVKPGRNTCAACLEGANIHHKTLMQQRRDAGQCTRCGVAKDVARYALCGGCREAGRAAQMDRRGR